MSNYDPSTFVVQTSKDPVPYFSFSHFFLGAAAGNLGMWVLFRATPLFESYIASNKRMVHVIFPVAVSCGLLANYVASNIEQDRLFNRWGPTHRLHRDAPYAVRHFDTRVHTPATFFPHLVEKKHIMDRFQSKVAEYQEQIQIHRELHDKAIQDQRALTQKYAQQQNQ